MLQTTFLTVAGYSLQAAVVILVVILMRFLLRKLGAPTVVSYALWAVVLFRLLCLFSIESSVGVIPQEIAYVPQEHAVEDYQHVPMDTALTSGALVFSNALDGNLDGADFTYESEEYGPNGDGQGKLFPEEALLLTLGCLWPAGIAALVIYSVIAWLRLRRKLVGAVPLEGNIRLADHIASPFVMGLFRPKIYLPSNLSEQEREYIILHEWHHIRRLDHIVKILAFAALCIHWFNPLVWLAFHLSGKDMEMSCDEAVVKKLGEGIRADYSASLLSLSTGRTVIAATPLAFGEGDTKGRIRNLANWKKPAVWITAVAVILCAAVIVLCATNSGGGNNLKVRIASGGIEVTCRFDDEVDDWAVYEDIYQGGERISSDVVLLNGEHPQSADPAKKLDYVFKVNMTGADGGGFASPLQYSAIDENGTIASREVDLPYETYGAFMMCAGDREAFPLKRSLGANDQAILFSAVLSLDEGTTVNLEDGVVGHNDTVVQYRLVTADTVRDWTETPEQPPRQFGPDQIYISERCLYATGLSSYFAAGGDSGYRYLMGDGGFTMIWRSTGAETVLAEGENWAAWEDFPWSDEEWNALFWPDGMRAVDISAYEEKLYCELKGGYRLLRMDGELWLMTLNSNDKMGTYVWEIYCLVPQSTKGSAQWEFAPMLSSREPYFKFELDVEYDEISSSCSDGKLEITEGVARWYPMDENGTVVDKTELSFALNREGQTTRFCTVYIQGSNVAGEGRTVYTATLTGTGLVMEQNPDGGAIIHRTGSGGKMTGQQPTGETLTDLFQSIVKERTPLYLQLTPAGAKPGSTYGAYGAWGCPNSVQSANALTAHTYQPLPLSEVPVGSAVVTLQPADEAAGWTVDFYGNSNHGALHTEGGTYYFRAVPQVEDAFLSPLGSLIRRWYDEAEFKSMDGYDGASIIIPNTGQNYLEAAQAWCEAYEGLHQQAGPGSKECYTYVSCRVEEAEAATALFREQGKIGENTYAFYAYTAFVPENEQALQWYMAGNTGAYTGEDPKVPKDALEYTCCGYITLEENGWHGVIAGSGW